MKQEGSGKLRFYSCSKCCELQLRRQVKLPRCLTKNLLEATPLPHVRNLLELEAYSDHLLSRKELVRWH